MTYCKAQKWGASSRVRGWGHFHDCNKPAVEGEELCASCLRVERRNNCQCDKCGADCREILVVGGRVLGTSRTAWAHCPCGKTVKFGRDNRIEMVRRGIMDFNYTDLEKTS